MEPVQPGGLLALLMYEGDSSQGTAAEGSRGTSSARREWIDGTIQFLVDMCAEKYFEIDRKQFKKSNWESFAAKLNTQFPEEPQRTWQQTRDKWNKMRSTYAEEKVKQEETGALPSTWTPWYEIFDNIFGGTAKIRGVHGGIDQGVRKEHVETIDVSSEDDETPIHSTPNTQTAPGAASSQSPRTQVVNQPGCEGQVNKSANKRKRKLALGEEGIASAIKDFSKGILEIEKMKMESSERLSEKMIAADLKTRELHMLRQLEMAKILAEVLKVKDSSSSKD